MKNRIAVWQNRPLLPPLPKKGLGEHTSQRSRSSVEQCSGDVERITQQATRSGWNQYRLSPTCRSQAMNSGLARRQNHPRCWSSTSGGLGGNTKLSSCVDRPSGGYQSKIRIAGFGGLGSPCFYTRQIRDFKNKSQSRYLSTRRIQGTTCPSRESRRQKSTTSAQRNRVREHAVALPRRKSRSTIEDRARKIRSRRFRAWLVDHLDYLFLNVKDQDFGRYCSKFKGRIYQDGLRPDISKSWVESKARNAWRPSAQATPQALFDACQLAFLVNDHFAVDALLRYNYQWEQVPRHVDDQKVARLADFSHPIEWYPATRAIQRTIHLHVGPTNSGKTYQALKRLEEAKTGVYAGPLRLLAHEVYSRLNARGKCCDLVTGDEQIVKFDPTHQASSMKSCTVEMVPLNKDFDVAVIDEIQMIGNDSRGWAWTQALLGLKARELHLCGEERTVPLIKDLVASMGDRLEVHTYKRLSPLQVMARSLGPQLQGLQKGDCIVSFSRSGIHAMKQEIEKNTQKRVAIVYGSLPPDIRTQQARLFNDPDNDYDYLVASDAIGMGLNLYVPASRCSADKLGQSSASSSSRCRNSTASVWRFFHHTNSDKLPDERADIARRIRRPKFRT